MLILCLTSTNVYLREPDAAVLDRCIGKIAGGDSAALAELYAETRVSIYGYALSVLKNTHDAEDVLHDCYVQIWSAAAGYRSAGKPMAWIMTIVRNLSLQKFRERKRTTDVTPEDLAEILGADERLNWEDRLVLGEILCRLTDEERQIVVLHALSGFKHREIAQLLELPLPTVLSKYSRALKKLKTHLTEGER